MDRWQMWAGPSQALPGLPGAPRRDGQLRRLRADRRGDEGIVVGARRPGRAARASSKAGTRASARCCSRSTRRFRWALYDREPLPTWTQGPAHAARRRRASDAAASRPGREPVDRGRHGARHDPARGRQRRACRPRCSPTSGCAASASPRSSSARGRTACASIPPTPTLPSATPSSRRTRIFGKRCTTSMSYPRRRVRRSCLDRHCESELTKQLSFAKLIRR